MTAYSAHSTCEAAVTALDHALSSCKSELPQSILQYTRRVAFSHVSVSGDSICFPCPLKEQEAVSVLKALEGCVAAAIADIRCGAQTRSITVNMDRVTCFLMSAYVTTINGMGKSDPGVKGLLPDTDLNKAQSVLYRRLSAGLYETCNPGEYFHIHGSMEASTTLRMIGLPPDIPGLTDYPKCIDTIEKAVKHFSLSELDQLNRENGQAGCAALTEDQFRKSPHGQALAYLPPFTVKPLVASSPPLIFKPAVSGQGEQCLEGVRVVELCRVIAGPTIGKSLAAHGAEVLKINSPQLPDVPFFQVDVNTGKHAAWLNLREPSEYAIFEDLLMTADVIVDGHRPGALTRLGLSPERLAARAAAHGRGIVYVAEDCYGATGVDGADLAHCPGWQQIADCVTGVAWKQGAFMQLNEPVVPPFPMSDYGTGCLGTIAALVGLHRRAVEGGSWICRTSLCQFNLFLLSLGEYPPEIQSELRERYRRATDSGNGQGDFFALRHHDSVDEISARALEGMKRLHPDLFADDQMESAYSDGFRGQVRWPKEALQVTGLKIGHVRSSRPNGFDPPSWGGWERDERLLRREATST